MVQVRANVNNKSCVWGRGRRSEGALQWPAVAVRTRSVLSDRICSGPSLCGCGAPQRQARRACGRRHSPASAASAACGVCERQKCRRQAACTRILCGARGSSKSSKAPPGRAAAQHEMRSRQPRRSQCFHHTLLLAPLSGSGVQWRCVRRVRACVAHHCCVGGARRNCAAPPTTHQSRRSMPPSPQQPRRRRQRAAILMWRPHFPLSPLRTDPQPARCVRGWAGGCG